MALILDTSFIIAAEREARRRQTGRTHEFLSQHTNEEFFITFTVAGELACGDSASARDAWESLIRPCYEAPPVNSKIRCSSVQNARCCFGKRARSARLLKFPPNACRGERCGVWGRRAPISLVDVR